MSEKEFACDTSKIHRSIVQKISELEGLIDLKKYEELMDIVQTGDSALKQDSSNIWFMAVQKITALLGDSKLNKTAVDPLVEVRRMILDYYDIVSDD